MSFVNQAQPVGLLAISVLVICTFILIASGLFPSATPIHERFGRMGGAGFYTASAITILLFFHVLLFAITNVAWYLAIIATGLVLLASPWIHAFLPDSIRDGMLGLFLLGACGAVLHLILFLA